MQKNFELLMESYKKLPLNVKKDNLIDELKEVIAIYLYLAESNGISVEVLKTKEILNLNTEDDYVEAVYAYFNVLKEIVSRLLESKYYE